MSKQAQAIALIKSKRVRHTNFALVFSLAVAGFAIGLFSIFISPIYGNFFLSAMPALYDAHDSYGAVLVLIATACGVWLSVLSMMYVYRMWMLIDPRAAEITPGKAVGFLFIPLFNLYWIFRVLWGWAVAFNRINDSRRTGAPRMPEGVFLGVCILTVLSVVPLVNLFVLIPLLALSLVMWSHICNAINHAALLSGS